MARTCFITGKKNKVVNRVTRRGKARAAGGVGRKTTGIHKRTQKANLQKKTVLVHGERRRVWLSAKALRRLPDGVELA
ncbi:50S ribosomal protein L28 [Deinococcus maricopensis]|uniref:Large ribosomal subunit protein bL28 n=1 Tax=Deinococcus maricopensis (strain DSM 21211 / LMG 22137 / NRRL B-23946 / LB-34) TaxID=709986 RepID=E8UAN4_DEIML|nr:50S ribosomal protein L28 [Deinococcus maricopensis]ADV68123.1 50S ribosomal protein L28 [Deinococcus maricopensis DSM 21211]